AVHPGHPLCAQPVGRVLHLQAAPGGRSHHQDVLGPGVDALGGAGGQSLHRDAVDLVVQVPGVPGGGADHQDDDHPEGDHDADDPAVTAGPGTPGPWTPGPWTPGPWTLLVDLLAEGAQPRLVGDGARHEAMVLTVPFARMNGCCTAKTGWSAWSGRFGPYSTLDGEDRLSRVRHADRGEVDRSRSTTLVRPEVTRPGVGVAPVARVAAAGEDGPDRVGTGSSPVAGGGRHPDGHRRRPHVGRTHSAAGAVVDRRRVGVAAGRSRALAAADVGVPPDAVPPRVGCRAATRRRPRTG